MITMPTPAEILLSLYGDRAEIANRAKDRYIRGIGILHPPELEEIDKQIDEISKQIPDSNLITRQKPNYISMEIDKGLKGTSEVGKQVVFISKDKGIYISDEKSYAIKKKRSEYVWKLKDGKKSSGFFYINASLLSKEIREINETCTKKLGLQSPLIISVPTGGYDLNREEFDVKFLDTKV